MGYCTMHTMDVLDVSEDVKLATIAKLRASNENAKYSIDEDGYPQGETKWYDHEPELREFSKTCPDVLIQLSGVGEENGDIWNHYFKNGKAQFCQAKMVMPDYNVKKMK